MKADIAIVASNSGFTKLALRKAARTGIGAVAVLRHGDARAKAKILQNIFLRKLTANGQINITYLDASGKPIQPADFEYGGTTINNESIDHWLVLHASMFQVVRPWETRRVRVDFRFFDLPRRIQRPCLSPLSHRYRVSVEHGVAAASRADRSRDRFFRLPLARLLLAPGENKLTYRDINFEGAQPCEPPTVSEYSLQGQVPGQAHMRFVKIVKVGDINVPSNSSITKLIVPADLLDLWREIMPPPASPA